MFGSHLLADFPGTVLWIAAGVIFVAGLMRGFAGFGSAMLIAPIFAALMTPAHMVPLLVALELPLGVLLFLQTRRQTDWGLVVPMAVAAAIGMPLGIWLLVSVDPRIMTIAISVIVLLFVGVLIAGWRYRGPRPLPLTAGIGGASGAMMATSGVGGPPVLLYMLAAQHPAATIRANIIAYFMLTSFVLIGMVMAASPTAVGAVIDAGILFPAMLLGAWLGMRLAGRASDRIYRAIAYSFLVAAALFGLSTQV